MVVIGVWVADWLQRQVVLAVIQRLGAQPYWGHPLHHSALQAQICFASETTPTVEHQLVQWHTIQPELPIIMITPCPVDTTAHWYQCGVRFINQAPVQPTVLLTQLRSVIPSASTQPLILGPVQLNLITRSIIFQAHQLALTRKEFQLVRLLAQCANQTPTWEQVCLALQGKQDASRASLDTLLYRLRKKCNQSGIPLRFFLRQGGLHWSLVGETQLAEHPNP